MKIGVAGYTGRMGSLIVREILSGHWPALSLAGGSLKPGYPAPADTPFPVTHDAEALFACADLVIDFTEPEATRRHVWLAAKHRKPCIIGTTGLDAVADTEIADAAREAPILRAANMSLGVNLLLALVERAAQSLGPEWDIEIFESHHRHKIDAPSGTALTLGQAAKAGRSRAGKGGETADKDKADPAPASEIEMIYARHGKTGERREGSIGFSVARGGDVAGEHTVFFFGEGERLELTHRANDRALFARGALRAAQWLHGRPAGLYSMRDVLGIDRA